MDVGDIEIVYEGSPYHKDRPSPWGPPKIGRSHKSCCPSAVAHGVAARVLTTAIRESLERGWHSTPRLHGLPRYVWGRSRFEAEAGGQVEVVWEAQSRPGARPAVFKAYPITIDRHASELPKRVRRQLWPDV